MITALSTIIKLIFTLLLIIASLLLFFFSSLYISGKVITADSLIKKCIKDGGWFPFTMCRRNGEIGASDVWPPALG